MSKTLSYRVNDFQRRTFQSEWLAAIKELLETTSDPDSVWEALRTGWTYATQYADFCQGHLTTREDALNECPYLEPVDDEASH